ncbi:hypothetical protein ABEB36_003044 [Hypothenemus hampei]|uniref:Trichohyalin-plectin-homology domain-containing protein n=1 Tax=Hypothenemus hampei TaxID=57062 RepID=A0ABD1F7T9_HYPHA
MFGGDVDLPKKLLKSDRRDPKRQDILLPSTIHNHYGHYAREPNTDHHVRLLHCRQRKEALDKSKEENEKITRLQGVFESKFDNRTTKKRMQKSVQERVQNKLKSYEQGVEARRNRLLELLSNEEMQYYYETVDTVQKGVDRKMEEMKQKAKMLKARREEERLQIGRELFETIRDRCQELRPHLEKQHLIESKYSQLQQMRENEAKREADRELDQMWYELNMKELDAKKEREVQEALERRNKDKDMLKIWDKQMKGKELLKEEMDRVAQEDRLEMKKLSDEFLKEEIQALDEKRRKRDETTKQILEQIEIQKRLKAQRKKEEDALDQAFYTLNQLELEREKASIHDATDQARKETAMYKKHLKELEEERKIEEKELMELLEIHRKEVEAKQDEARCKIVEAKRKLQQNVLAERAQQIIYKKQEAEQQLRLKEAENELLRMAYETNERLQAESDRLCKQEALQYREDLRRQIEYNNVLRQREREELERQLEEGLKEEKLYREIVEQMLRGEIEANAKHPFRKVLEQYDCHCPKAFK